MLIMFKNKRMQNKTLTIEGITYTPKELFEISGKIILNPAEPEWKRDIFDFILDWMDDRDFVEVKTSGTTGDPKTIKLSKKRMIASAKLTGEYFDLLPENRILLSLPAKYIAGKMMIVRAIVLGLDLHFVSPSSGFWKEINSNFDFVAVVPLQIKTLLKHPAKANYFKTILIGGAALDTALENELQQLSAAIFHSYGMTETITHVAIRTVNGKEHSEYYRALSGISFSVNRDNCLTVHTSHLDKNFTTNDIVQLQDKHHFKWLGRADNVINSGGIKISPEILEKKIAHLIKNRFCIAGIKDKTLGQKLVLIIEGTPFDKQTIKTLKNKILEVVEKHENPKEILFTNSFTETSTGKIVRKNSI